MPSWRGVPRWAKKAPRIIEVERIVHVIGRFAARPAESVTKVQDSADRQQIERDVRRDRADEECGADDGHAGKRSFQRGGHNEMARRVHTPLSKPNTVHESFPINHSHIFQHGTRPVERDALYYTDRQVSVAEFEDSCRRLNWAGTR